jgi:hypothetical protein
LPCPPDPCPQDAIRIEATSPGCAPRFLPVGARACHVPHPIGSSLLVTLSPRLVIVNRTGAPLEYKQAGCGTDGAGLIPPAAEAAEADAHAVLHWQQPMAPKALQLRRLGRGAEWSGAVALSALLSSPLSSAAELTIRLRDLQESTAGLYLGCYFGNHKGCPGLGLHSGRSALDLRVWGKRLVSICGCAGR